MPTDNPTIVVSNTPMSARRAVHCRFVHAGIVADIEIQDAFGPELSSGLENIKARKLLASLATALAARVGDYNNPSTVITGHLTDLRRDVQALFRHGGVTAELRMPGAVNSANGAGSEHVEARERLRSMSEALAAALT